MKIVKNSNKNNVQNVQNEIIVIFVSPSVRGEGYGEPIKALEDMSAFVLLKMNGSMRLH